MNAVISSPTAHYRLLSNPQIIRTSIYSSSSTVLLKSANYDGQIAASMLLQKNFALPRRRFRCNCSSTPGEPAPGDNESKQVLDAFFLGKAVAETLNERIESAVGEFLSLVGRLQAEQQKQVQDFQDEVLERAKKAKEKAAREALETQGVVPVSAASDISSATANGSRTGSVAVDEGKISPSSSSSGSKDQSPNDDNTDPLLGISVDD